MDERFLAETLALRPRLFRAMLEFNRDSSAMPDALSRLGRPLQRLWQDVAFRRAWPCPETTSGGYWNFSEESRRLALLDAATLHRLGLFFSTAVHAEELSCVIERSEVLSLRQTLGADTCAYALKRGRYQIGSLRQVLLPPASLGTLSRRIEILASASLSLLCAEWPETLRMLAAPRFPQEEHSADFPPKLRREQRTALWFTMKKLLLREVAPEWAPCFD